MAVDSFGKAYAVGILSSGGAFDLGNGVNAWGGGSINCLLACYYSE